MHYTTILASLSMVAVTFASPASPLLARTSCSTPDGDGTCEATSSCTAGFSVAGYCPGAANIQCCVKKSCSTSSGSGTCMKTSDSCSGGSFIAGACPGPSDVECCVKKGSTPPSSGSGSGIVNAAVAEEGIPYVYGGGGCDGPSDGGFDCSGLTQYAVCKALKKEIPRTAQTQYDSSMGTRLARADAKPGDMLFWATGGDCSNAVEHVGIFMGNGEMVNAATTGTPVREQPVWTSSGGLDICPDAVRFW